MLPTRKSYFIPELLLPQHPFSFTYCYLRLLERLKKKKKPTLCEMNQESVGLASATIVLSLSGRGIIDVMAGAIFRRRHC